jgi:hypothetical protein
MLSLAADESQNPMVGSNLLLEPESFDHAQSEHIR